MKISIMQPYFIPYIGYFQLINKSDFFLSYGKVSFRKKSWIQRNRLINKSNGDIYYEGIPILRQSSNKSIDQIKIDNGIEWQHLALRRIETNYRTSYFYDETLPLLKNIYQPADSLYDFISDSITLISKHLNITTTILRSDSGVYDQIESSINNGINNLEPKTERIVSLTKHHNCDQYINPIGGLELYDKSVFNNCGISLAFLKSQAIEYGQFDFTFRPYLSVLDTLFHCGKQATSEYLSHCELL